MSEEKAAGRGEERAMQARIEIVPFKAEHARQMLWVNIPAEVVALYEKHGIGYTAMNGKPIAAAGIVIVGPGEAEAWGLIGEEAKTKPFMLHRATKRILARLVKEHDLTYVNIVVDPNNFKAVEWAKRLGFKLERTVEIYSWTK